MGTEVTVHQPAMPVNWNQELEGARMLLKSGLLPQSLRSPEAAMFVILTGRDLGLSPVQSLRSIHVIQGKIEVAADAQLGLFHRSGGRSHWRALTNESAVLELHAPWLTEPHVEAFTLEDAKRAKLGGDNWQKYPKAMLRSRAITAALKSIGFDPTAGMYAPGEISGVETVVEGELVGHGVTDANGEGTVLLAEPVVVVDPLDEALEQMYPQVDVETATKARKAVADGHDKRKVLNRLTERVLANGGAK